jgi:sugar (pentulose or hexulose) kinase
MLMGSDNKITDNQRPDQPSLNMKEKIGEPVIAIFDVGKTNKKLLLFDEQYKSVYEESKQFTETADEDDFPCEDIFALTEWVKESFSTILKDKRFEIKGVNFSGYGASFVYIDKEEQVIAPLYNYLKPYPEKLKDQFYHAYGGESLFAKKTASPVLGNLNSGMQLYRLKYEQPGKFDQIKYALHLPQYLSFILTRKLNSDITSIGCHTNLWNFQNNKYHAWVKKEGVESKLPAVKIFNEIAGYVRGNIPVGIGMHDSSAALIPYLTSFNEPFILLSTGTWCVTLNPFNHSRLTDYELKQDCLCYLSYQGKPVKASRLFAGYEHEQQTKKLATYFNKPLDYYKTIQYDKQILSKIKPAKKITDKETKEVVEQSAFGEGNLNLFTSYEEAYHQLIAGIIAQQIHSTNLVLKGTAVKRIFTDGGFCNNPIYMHLLSKAFPQTEVYAASVAQASALGAALAIHQHWNTGTLPPDMIDLKLYSVAHKSVL